MTTVQNVTNVGSRAFYLNDGQWTDGEEVGKRKVRVVKLFSPEYFELLKTNATFAKAQQLGWALSINIGDERIVVEKDGKQKDEELRKLSQPHNDFQQGPNQVPPGLEQRIRPGRPGVPPNQIQDRAPLQKNLQPAKQAPNGQR